MAYTIATHNGSAVSPDHNRRNPCVTAKEDHINPNGKHETWHDEKIRQAYRRIFGQSVANYNAALTRSDRMIKSYYDQVAKSTKQHTAYEMIISIGNKNNLPPEDAGRQAMKDFVDGWKDTNPNLELIGAYYHADEKGVPHVHIDYIPVAHGYERGMETRNGLTKALGEMGFHKVGRDTAQIQWERSENQRLEDICKAHGLEIEHPRAENLEHIDTRLYKAMKRADEAERKAQRAEARTAKMEARLEKAEVRTREQETRAVRLEERCDQLGIDMRNYERIQERYNALESFVKGYSITTRHGEKESLWTRFKRENADLFPQRNNKFEHDH